MSQFFSSNSDYSSCKLSFLLSPSVSLILCLSVYLTPSRCFSHSISLSHLLSIFLCISFSLSLFLSLYLPIYFFLSLLCSSSLLLEYYFVNLVSASKSVYLSVFNFNYINCLPFFFLCIGLCFNIYDSLYTFSFCYTVDTCTLKEKKIKGS